jgi:hypothetical protein
LVFQVSQAGQTSAPPQDVLIFPAIPSVTNVTGCLQGRRGCPTPGGVNLTITGEFFIGSVQVYLRGGADLLRLESCRHLT